MPQLVSLGAVLSCSFGTVPMPMIVLPETPVLEDELPAATIMDFVSLENIPSFGLCTSLANPEVAAATAAALGVLTPMPCVPVTTSPWFPGAPTVLLKGIRLCAPAQRASASGSARSTSTSPARKPPRPTLEYQPRVCS